jgi:hypothetical protein
MSQKSTEDAVKRLMALGHSKTKAAKALKDCGNNFTQAKSLLEQIAAEKEKQLRLEEKTRQREKEEAERKKEEEEKKALQQLVGVFQPNSSEPEQNQQKKIRLHPCMVQYRSCRYGKFCLLKDFPGDTCINYFHGDCVYGSACRNRHTINGVDLRYYARQAQMEQESVLLREANGATVYLSESAGAGVLIGERHLPEPQPQDDRQNCLPQAYMWNVSAGSAPSYSDPIVESVLQQLHEDDEEASPAAPFLEKVRQPKTGHQRAPVVVVGSGSNVVVDAASQPAQQQMIDLSKMTHPCIAQCGGCKYGDGCLHAHKRADICVFFLNGRCSFPAEQCRFRHDATNTSPLQAPPSPSVPYVLKPNAVIGGQSMWGLSETAVARREREALEVERMYAPPPAMSQASRGAISPLSPVGLQAPPTSPYMPSVKSAFSPTSGPHRPRTGPPPLTREDEQNAFEALHAVFPAVSPALLLHSIRLANGDRHRVANMIVASPTVTEGQLDSLLDAEGSTKDPECASNVLLTLCHLFPGVEVDVIESALSAAAGDYSEAYCMLTCSAEHVGQDAANDWGSSNVSAGDQLKLHKLYAMFPDLPKEVVDVSFAQVKNNTPAAVEVLNQLLELSQGGASPMLTVDERQALAAESTTFVVTSPSQHPAPPPHSPLLALPGTRISNSQLYAETAKEVNEHCDWRRVRQEAYAVGRCRIRTLCHASAAFLRGDGQTAKLLSSKAKELRVQYDRLNMLAMHALERERQGESLSTLDLHGFHVKEAIDVLQRRLALCAAQHVRRVRVVVGEGRHSSKGQSTVYPAVYEELQRRGQSVRIISVRPAFIDIELVTDFL